MKFCVDELQGRNVRFEWPTSIIDTSWGQEMPARYVDIVIENGTAVKPGQTINAELKSWTEFTLRGKAASAQRGQIQYQLTRDTALFSKDNIMWVFDGTKVQRDLVVKTFTDIILRDPYLKKHWGEGRAAVEAALANVIVVHM